MALHSSRLTCSITVLPYDVLVRIFSILSKETYCRVLPSVCRAFYHALKQLGILYEVVDLDLRSPPPHASIDLLQLEMWSAPRGPFVRLLTVTVPDDWESFCKATVERVLALCSNLVTVKLRFEGRLGQWPQSLTALPRLASIFITADNTFERMPSWLGELKQLEQFHFKCRIDAGNYATNRFFPVEMLLLPRLRVLSMVDCNQLVLSQYLGDMQALEELRIRGAALTLHPRSFPPDCCAAKSLTSLELRACRLASFPHQVANLTALRSLDLSDNRLTSLPSLLAAQQVFLEAIDLSANDFNHIPMVLKNMRRLRVINLSYNDALQVAQEDAFGGTRRAGNHPVTSSRKLSLAQLVSNLSMLRTLHLVSNDGKVWSDESWEQIRLVQRAVQRKEHWCHLRELRMV